MIPATVKKSVPRAFVRYANRKLHEIGEGRPYTTMEELLAIVAAGELIKITDDDTGEDMTARILARLIYDRSRMGGESFNSDQLQQLIMSNPPPKD